MERPLCFLEASERPGLTGRVTGNAAGLRKLYEAIAEILDGGSRHVKFQVYQNGNWNDVRVQLCPQAAFDHGGTPCACGCQDAFARSEREFLAAAGGASVP